MNEFKIRVNGNEIGVVQLGEDTFRVRLPEKTIHLLRKEDDEGANHWFEEGMDNETSQLSELGTAIESYLLAQ